MTDPTPLDLDAIRQRATQGYPFLGLWAACNDVLVLIHEVKRLRLDLEVARADRDNAVRDRRALAARPDPAWDEEAVAEAVRKDLEAVGILPWTNGGARIVRTVLAVVREHLPVKPSREEVARALALVGDYDGCFERLDAWAAASSEARECGDVEEPMSTDGEDAEW